jgi:hypothetical protein
MTMAVATKKARVESGDEVKDKKSSRLWIDPSRLPTRLAQKGREQEHPSSHWLKKPEAGSQAGHLKLADVALKHIGDEKPEENRETELNPWT